MNVIATRKDFIDVYVGWSYVKTTKFLQDNINNQITIDESEGSLFFNENDSFGLEAIMAIKKFDKQIKFLNEDKLQYYFQQLGSKDKLTDLFQVI